MKILCLKVWLLLGCALSATMTIKAQSDGLDTLSEQSKTVDICDYLSTTKRVSIKQDPRFENLLSPKSVMNIQERTAPDGFVFASGFRIRVFSGNNQIESKNRAYSLSKEISKEFPDLNTYVFFKTPNWRLMAGNFRTMEEAHTMLTNLKKKFPKYGREMFIVRDEIELPIK